MLYMERDKIWTRFLQEEEENYWYVVAKKKQKLLN